jgi:glucan phosphoethanolaminetransferase (alkaline phosphatase superfamily)
MKSVFGLSRFGLFPLTQHYSIFISQNTIFRTSRTDSKMSDFLILDLASWMALESLMALLLEMLLGHSKKKKLCTTS